MMLLKIMMKKTGVTARVILIKTTLQGMKTNHLIADMTAVLTLLTCPRLRDHQNSYHREPHQV